mgnify:CR=1 FL=1
MSAFMIRTEHLSHTYKDETGNLVYAVKDVSLTVAPGEFVAVIGTNGSGKSTLAKHFNALLLPTEGVCEVAGMRTDIRENVWNIRQHVGMVFQNPDNQIVAAVVEEDVAFGPENLGVPPAEIRVRVDTALERVGMSAFAKQGPHLLSGGQKQRIAIAGILAMQSDCIVLDEPTAMLDPSGRAEVMKTLLQLHEEGITVVLITHFMEEAALADRVLVMNQGEVVLDGSPKEVFQEEALLMSLKLDVPVATMLANRLRKDYPCLPRDILTIDELVEVLCPSH